MNALGIADFDAYFHALHGHGPYPWQRRLAERAVTGDWPGAIDLPTGSGKTACIDIAIFALACQAALPIEQRNAPRRVFFCVNRRVIVDEAHTRARYIAEKIYGVEQGKVAGNPILDQVAKSLRKVAGTTADEETPPLDVLELRGGIYRDNRWARSITQPTIVCTTLDQLGSRLLFRGYGVSSGAAPIQAALIAYDSLILLDEAHISEPFRQTLEYVQRYIDPQKWAEQPIGMRPVTVVPMTATPNDEMVKHGVIELEVDDRDPELPLLQRLAAAKQAVLRVVKDVAKEAVEMAVKQPGDQPVAVGIIVNRVATAKAIYDQILKLQAEPSDKKRKVPCNATVELVIGSMRPIDRDKQAKRLRTLVGPDRPAITDKPSFIVATQCLEVGADYDFDVLITECASLDALRQRFGRLNRAGRTIDAHAFILANKKDIKDENKLDDSKPVDPIYGNALARTWNWLTEHATDGIVNFGIDPFAELLKEHGEENRPPKNLLARSALLDAPVMLPAYVDFWCQTAPRPVPDPDVSLFIHGTQRSEPDVQICWRADIGDTTDDPSRKRWPDVVALLPPTSAECMSVPISRARRWLAQQMDNVQDHGDALGIGEADDDKMGQDKQVSTLKHPGVLWRGVNDSLLIESPDSLRPGDTLVLPASTEASSELGHLPDTEHASNPERAVSAEADQQPQAVADVAEQAFTRSRDIAALRLHSALRYTLPTGEAFGVLYEKAADRDNPPSRSEWSSLLKAAAVAMPDNDGRKKSLQNLANSSFHIEVYPDQRGVVLTGRKRLGSSNNWLVRATDDGDDESSRSFREAPVSLMDHTQHVVDAAATSLKALPLSSLTSMYRLAAMLHDLGKADERFQAMIRRADRTDAWLRAGVTSTLLAKSDGLPQTLAQRRQARERAGLPAGFRHEMLSVQLAELSPQLPSDPADRDMVLHLIAAHHGHARPFAPVVPDDELPALDVNGIALSHEQRSALIPAHQMDSGIAERFWRLARRYGWWGLAYLEAVLRLADQQASDAEDVGKYEREATNQHAEATT